MTSLNRNKEKRQTQGKRKINMKENIDDKESRQVTFSKRISGQPLWDKNIVEEHNEGHDGKIKELEGEKGHNIGTSIAKPKWFESSEFWWNKDIDGMGVEELEHFIKSLEELINNVERKVDEK